MPQYGSVLEAGCGLGRYGFYLTELGLKTMGLDFSENVIEEIKLFKKENSLNAKFCQGNVKWLPFKDNILSGYISLGVIDHFIEWPQKALKEAYRILRQRRLAIIFAPSFSLF